MSYSNIYKSTDRYPSRDTFEEVHLVTGIISSDCVYKCFVYITVVDTDYIKDWDDKATRWYRVTGHKENDMEFVATVSEVYVIRDTEHKVNHCRVVLKIVDTASADQQIEENKSKKRSRKKKGDSE